MNEVYWAGRSPSNDLRGGPPRTPFRDSFRLADDTPDWRREGNHHLHQVHVEQSQPILDGLQREAAEDESDAEDAEPTFGKVVRVVFDIRNDRLSHTRDNARHQTHPDGKGPRVIHVMDEVATDECHSKIAKGADDSRPKLTTCKARTASCQIIHARSYAARIAEYLTDCDENSK